LNEKPDFSVVVFRALKSSDTMYFMERRPKTTAPSVTEAVAVLELLRRMAAGWFVADRELANRKMNLRGAELNNL